MGKVTEVVTIGYLVLGLLVYTGFTLGEAGFETSVTTISFLTLLIAGVIYMEVMYE